MQNKIVKSLKPDVSDNEILRSGLGSFVSWERLKPYLEESIGNKPNESIRGIIADENGISIILDYL